MIEKSKHLVFDRQEILFMLRRIENDIDKEENLWQIVQLIREKNLAPQELLLMIQKHMIKKEEVWQTILAALR